MSVYVGTISTCGSLPGTLDSTSPPPEYRCPGDYLLKFPVSLKHVARDRGGAYSVVTSNPWSFDHRPRIPSGTGRTHGVLLLLYLDF